MLERRLYWHLGQKSNKYQIRTEHRNWLARSSTSPPASPSRGHRQTSAYESQPLGDLPKTNNIFKRSKPRLHFLSEHSSSVGRPWLPPLIREVKRWMGAPRLPWRKLSTMEFTSCVPQSVFKYELCIICVLVCWESRYYLPPAISCVPTRLLTKTARLYCRIASKVRWFDCRLRYCTLGQESESWPEFKFFGFHQIIQNVI